MPCSPACFTTFPPTGCGASCDLRALPLVPTVTRQLSLAVPDGRALSPAATALADALSRQASEV